MSHVRPILITDSDSDLPADLFATLDAEYVSMHFTLDGSEYADDFGRSMSHAAFYAKLRAGAHPTTTAVPPADYLEVFERCVAAGRPALLVGLSSKLSSSFDVAVQTAAAVNASHAGADIRVVDSVSASVALGFLVVEAAARIREGYDIDTLERWIVEQRCRVNGYFAVDSLEHLRRGGRISDVAAFAGTVLGIRPLLRLDPVGALAPVGQVRGRRKSIRALVEIAEKRVIDPASQVAFIAHGDAPEDAESLRDQLLARLPFRGVQICELGPVIATHVGPGMLAVVFFGQER